MVPDQTVPEHQQGLVDVSQKLLLPVTAGSDDNKQASLVGEESGTRRVSQSAFRGGGTVGSVSGKLGKRFML